MSLVDHPKLTDDERQFAIRLVQGVMDYADEIHQRLRGIFFPRLVELNVAVTHDPDSGEEILNIRYTIHGLKYENAMNVWNETSQMFGTKFPNLHGCFSVSFETKDSGSSILV